MSGPRRLFGPHRAVTVSVVLHASAFVAFAFAAQTPPAVAPTVITILPTAAPEPELSTQPLPSTAFAEPPSVNDPVFDDRVDDEHTPLRDAFCAPAEDMIDVIAMASPQTYANVRLHAAQRRPAAFGSGGGARSGEGPGGSLCAPPVVAAQSMPIPPAAPKTTTVGPTHPPRFASAPEIPAYPELARRRRWEGSVRIRIAVDAGGAVSDVTVALSSGKDILDAAAVASARAWRLLPAVENGTPVAATFEKSIQFSLID